MTISQHLINIQRAKFLSWYYFKELPSSCMNTHLHTYVDQRTLSALGNFCNVCLPQNLFLSWCRNSLSYFQQVRSKGITLEKKKTWDFSIYLFTQTAPITRRNRRPNRRQASHVQQPPTCWMQWEKKLSDTAQVKYWRLCTPCEKACMLMLALPIFSVQFLSYFQTHKTRDYWFPGYSAGSDYSERSQGVH